MRPEARGALVAVSMGLALTVAYLSVPVDGFRAVLWLAGGLVAGGLFAALEIPKARRAAA